MEFAKELMRQRPALDAKRQKQTEPEDDLMRDMLSDLQAPSRLVETKYPSLDRLMAGGLQKGKCSAVFGPAGNAKSIFVLNMVVRMVQGRGEVGGYDPYKANPLYIPLEYTRTDHARRAMGVVIGSWGLTSEEDKKKAEAVKFLTRDEWAQDWVRGLQNHIAHNPTTARRNAAGDLEIPKADYTKMLKAISSEAKERDLIVVDPLTAIDPDDLSKRNSFDQQTEFLRACNAIAIESNVHIMFVTHSGRRQKHNGKEVALTMDNVAGSISITRFVQYVLILDYHRGEKRTGQVYKKGGAFGHVEYTRTLKIDKLNAGCGTGAELAVDFTQGPQMEVFGMLKKD